MEYLIPLLVLSFLIFIHELGHFFGAKLVGVKVEEFAIGFPPRLFTKTVNGTKYCLSLLLLGGYVRLKGQNLEDEDAKQPDNYASKTIKERFIILIGGPLMNLIFAIIILPISYMIPHASSFVLSQPPTIEFAQANSLAEQAGIKAFDRIISINDQKVDTWNDFNELIQTMLSEETIQFEVVRDGSDVHLVDFTSQAILEQGLGWEPYIPALVGKVRENSPAQRAGLQAGDLIIQANESEIQSFRQIQAYIQTNQNKPFVLRVERANRVIEIPIKAEFDAQLEQWYIGFHLPVRYESLGFTEAWTTGMEKIGFFTLELGNFFKRLFSGGVTKNEVGGPIAIFKILADSNERGLSYLLFLAAFISLQLAIFNLLPIPALDGGHIFLLLVEKIKGSSLTVNLRRRIQTVGFFALIFLMLLITFFDITRFF